MRLALRINRVVFTGLCGCSLIGLGLAVLLGWAIGNAPLLTVLPGRITMKPNTAMAFLCAGAALTLLNWAKLAVRTRICIALLSALVVIIGAATAVEYLFQHNFRIDELLFQDRAQFPFPGRMAQITAVNFCLMGTSLFLLAISDAQAKWAQLLALLSGFSATLAMIGYAYGVPLLYGSVQYTSMALHTGAGFLVLSAGILHCRPTLGFMQVIGSDYAGGWLARRLLPFAVLVPAGLGAVYVRSTFSQSTPRLSLACLIVLQVVLFVSLIWALAFLLNRLEAEKNIAQLALRDSQERLEHSYRTMFEEAIVGMFRSTPDGQFVDVNPAMAAMFGYGSAAEMLENVVDVPNQLYSEPERRNELKALLDQHGNVRNFECQMYRKDGTVIWISSNVRAVCEGGTIIRYEGTNSDITERKQLEEQLMQSQKMEAVGRLAGGVAHDFNNAIGVVVGYSTLLKDRVAADKKSVQYIEEISKAGHRAASLTRQLLAFSRKQVIQPVVLDLNTVVQDTDRMLRRLIGEDIKMTVNLSQDACRIKADRGQLEQVLMNLAVNGRDAMPQGGQIIIETLNTQLDSTALVRHPEAKAGDYVALSVSDTGCGMDKETQRRIFEPFFTTKPVGKGTGLGLSTVYGIVRQSEGYIWVYSELGQGTRFKIYFPRIASAAEAPAEPPLPSMLPRGTETILLVEDDEAMRQLTMNCLASFGYRALVARDPEQAILVASQESGPIHLLLTDVVMPGASGRQVAEGLSIARPEMKVLYVSGYTADLIADHGVLESDVALLEKPFTREELVNKVRQVLDGGRRTRAASSGI